MTQNPAADRMRNLHPDLVKALDILGEIDFEHAHGYAVDAEKVPHAVAAILSAGMAWERERAALVELERLQDIELKYKKAQKASKLTGVSTLTKLDLINDALTTFDEVQT